MSFLSKLFGKGKLNYRKRYELLQSAISGTMSNVYKARDRETGELVALKILDMKKTTAVEVRWKGQKKPTEGEIAVLFDHPYIVKTLDQGLTTDGEQYLVMEYLEGTGGPEQRAHGARRPDGRRPRLLHSPSGRGLAGSA